MCSDAWLERVNDTRYQAPQKRGVFDSWHHQLPISTSKNLSTYARDPVATRPLPPESQKIYGNGQNISVWK